MFPYEAIFSSNYLLYIIDIYRKRNKVIEHLVDILKCHQLLITRDIESEHFLPFLCQLNVPWRVGEESIISGINQGRLLAVIDNLS